MLSSSNLVRVLLCGVFFLTACEGNGAPEELPRQTFDGGGDAAADVDAAADAQLEAGSQSDAGAAADANPGDAATGALCPSSAFVAEGCVDLGGRDERLAGLCDGFDNNCDGRVDEGCACDLGSVHPCFPGPPSRAHVGACSMGVQTCEPAGEFGALGKCIGATAPRAETCDGLDNDCNGCADDVQACVAVLKCPAAGDPRIPRGVPFGTVQLDASAFYTGTDVASVQWSIEGSPCDKLFLDIPGSSATASNGQLSFVLQGANQRHASARFTLSGTYAVTLRIVLTSGEEVGCTFPLQVAGPGLRVELCWDKTGPTSAGNPLDLDLHLSRRGSSTTLSSAQDFYYDTFSPPFDPAGVGLWGHPNTPNASGCLTGDPSLDLIHGMRGNCLNPRLDADNQDRTDRYVAENINLDNPRAGEQFQIAVQHTSEAAMRTRARVNVYCAGTLRGSYELDPQRTAFSDDTGNREYWHVAQIAPSVDANGVMTDCSLAPLTPMDAPGTPLVTVGPLDITWRE